MGSSGMFEGPLVAVGLACVGLVVLVVVGVALFLVIRKLRGMMPGGAVAEVEAGVQEPFAFELRYTSPATMPRRLCLIYGLQGLGTGGGRYASGTTGMVCDYQVTVGGKELAREAVAHGSAPPPPFDRHITTAYKTRRTVMGTDYTTSGTVVLCELVCPAGEELVASGTFRFEPNTTSSELTIFLGR